VITRRALLAGAAAGAAVHALPASAAVQGDAAVLGRLQPIEQALAFTYGAALNSGSARVREIAGRFGPHEAEHVAELDRTLEALGARKPAPPASAADVDRVARALGISPGLSQLRTPEEILGFVMALEQQLVQAWVGAHRKLADARWVQLGASILGCQAQHLVVLRGELGRDALPIAVEPGR
jgi:hypothetical protein